jgi:hypothetical protein
MNRKQFVILLVLVAVIGGAGLMLYRKQASSWTGGDTSVGKKLLGEFPVNDVAQIVIKQGAGELTLAKQDDLWRVRERDNYAANFSEISGLLLKLKDLKVVQTEKVGPSQLPRLALATGQGTNSATTVEFRDTSGKAIKTLLLGKPHMRSGAKSSPMDEFGDGGGYPDGRYVMVGGASDLPRQGASAAGSVAVVSDPLSNVEAKPDSWLNKDFFKVEKVRTVAVTFPNATNSWKLTRETESGEWKLAGAKPGEQLDSGKASGVSNPLSSPNFVDVATGAKLEETGLGKPTTVTLETFDGFNYTVKVGAKTNDNYFLTVAVAANLPPARIPGKDEKAEDKDKLDKEFKEKQKKLEDKLAQEKTFEKWTYLVAGWTVDPLLKERSQLFVEKKDESKKDEPKSDEKPKEEKQGEN